MFRVGIVGAGLMGALHAKTLASMPGVEVVSIANRTFARAEAVAAEVGAKPYDDYRAVIDSPVDAVWVATPDFDHVEISSAVLQSGKHLFLEKALATSIADGEKILEQANANPHLKAMVGYPLRFDPRYQMMHRVLNEEGAGRSVMAWSLRAHFLHEKQLVYDKYRDEYYHPPSWYFDRSKGRGPIYSHASHDYDMLTWLCGPIESVFARGDTYLLEKGDVADGFVLSLRFKNGGVATVSTPWVTRVEYDMVGVATENLTVVNNNGEIRIKRGEDPEETVRFADNPMWTAMNRHFMTCVLEDKAPLISIADGLQAITVAEAAYRSLYEGREVTVASVMDDVA